MWFCDVLFFRSLKKKKKKKCRFREVGGLAGALEGGREIWDVKVCFFLFSQKNRQVFSQKFSAVDGWW